MSFIVFVLVVIWATNVLVFLRNLKFYMLNVGLHILEQGHGVLFTATAKFCKDKSVIPNTIFQIWFLEWRNVSVMYGTQLKRGTCCTCT